CRDVVEDGIARAVEDGEVVHETGVDTVRAFVHRDGQGNAAMAGQRDRLGRVGRAIDHGDRRIRAVARHVDAVAARVHGERPDAAGYRDGGGRGRRIREVDDAHVVRAAVGDVELV